MNNEALIVSAIFMNAFPDSFVSCLNFRDMVGHTDKVQVFGSKGTGAQRVSLGRASALHTW